MRLPAVFIAAALVCGAAPSAAQSVKVEFDNGRVTVKAENVTVRSILNEWARRGSTRMVNVDRVTGPPVTIELASVPEQQAIEILLRGVAGYMIGWRETGPEMPAASAFDRVMLLPTSTVVRSTPPPPGPPPPRQPVAIQNDDDDEPTDPAVVSSGARLRERPDDDEIQGDNPPPPPGTSATPFGNSPSTSRPGVIMPPVQPRRAGPTAP
jgi:hypothetical protein